VKTSLLSGYGHADRLWAAMLPAKENKRNDVRLKAKWLAQLAKWCAQPAKMMCATGKMMCAPFRM